MKIVITGGKHEADYIVSLLKKENHELIVINEDPGFAEYISSHNDIDVFPGDPSKAYVLQDAEAQNADVLLALSDNDTNNYVTCVTAKKLFNIKKTVSKVKNVMLEVPIKNDYAIVNKEIQSINFPNNMNISCIFRDPDVIIPHGQTKILEDDNLIIITTPEEQYKLIEFIQKKR